jgi:hypothetical protein
MEVRTDLQSTTLHSSEVLAAPSRESRPDLVNERLELHDLELRMVRRAKVGARETPTLSQEDLEGHRHLLLRVIFPI